MLETALTVGVGLTVMVNVNGDPVQPLAAGITVMVAITGRVVVLVAVKEAILPAPLAARPIEVVLLVQLKMVPATGPVKEIADVLELLQ